MDSNSVLEIFREITKIPRESGHEEKMTEYLQQFAAKHNLACRTDKTGNVVITREASEGKENVPAIALQSRLSTKCWLLPLILFGMTLVACSAAAIA